MNETRRFQGIAYWEKSLSTATHLSTIALPYLDRNLRRELDRHQHDLARERGHDLAVEAAGVDVHERIAGWDFPNANMLKTLINTAPMIRIENFALRHTDSAQVRPKCHKIRSGGAGDPDWLPAESEWSVPCQLQIRLMYQYSPKSEIFQSKRNGHILRHDHPSKDPAFEIVLESPIEIPLAELKVLVDYKDSEGNNRWKRARDDENCSLEFRIECHGSAHSAELWSQLERRDISEYRDMISDEGHIRCTWHNLPDLPSSGHLLDLKRSQRKKLKEMRYKAEVGIFWTQEFAPLAVWNRACLVQQQESSRQLLTPSVSDDADRPRKIRVQYLSRQGGFMTKGAAAAGLSCIMSSCHGRAEHSSLERLMFHYAIHHDRMRFEISPERSRKDLAVIFVSRAEASSSTPSSQGQHFVWEAPKNAFDIDAHLDGTKLWTVKHSDKSQSAHESPQKVNRRRMHGGHRDHSSYVPVSLGRVKGIVRKAEDVLDLPDVPRKRHKVPRVESISFYRTLSKQLVSAGEEISDSEAEADMGWAAHIQRHEQTLLGIDRITQDFNALLNKHLDQEQPMSDIFVQEAIVRFARKYTPQLSQREWKDVFRAKLGQFEEKRIINRDIVTYCMGLLASAVQADVENVCETSPSSRGANGTFVRREGDSERRTPERRTAMSPPSQMSTKRRLRWRDGHISRDARNTASNDAQRRALGSLTPVPANRRQQTKFLGRRMIICRRGSKASELHHVHEFVRNGRREVSHDHIKPSCLDLAKFKKMLDDELRLVRKDDIIVCTSIDPAKPILDIRDWESALQDIHNDDVPGNIEFELRPRSSLENLRRDCAKRKKVGDDALARKSAAVIQANECLCGTKADGLRGIIACGNTECPRRFHLSCLNLRQRPTHEWRCVDCR